MSDANRVALRYVAESTWGTTPANPTLLTLRMTDENIIPEVETITSNEIRSDRMVADLVQVSRQNSGPVNFELSYATFDDLLEAAMFEDWATDVLETGTTKKFFSMEKALLDIDEYFLFTGMMVNQFTLNLATKSIATGSFEFLGGACTLAQSAASTTVTAANTNTVMNCMANVASLREGSTLTALTGIYVQELSFTVNNNLRPVHAIGSNTIQEIAVGKQDITGTLNAYFTSDRLFDQFLAGSSTKLDFQIQDAAGNSYTVLFPNVKFESDQVSSPGQDQDVIETLTWRALYDSSEGTQMRITRASA